MKSHAMSAEGKRFVLNVGLGALITIILIHPTLEFLHLSRSNEATSLGLLIQSLGDAFSPQMINMTLILGGIGAMGGAFITLIQRRRIDNKSELKKSADEVEALIEGGESEQLEFKSSLRWDRNLGKVNKVLEAVIAKTLCGMMNNRGGILLIGIDDNGKITGIEKDLETLRRPNKDAFEQRLITIATTYLGGHNTDAIHTQFHALKGKWVAVIQIDAKDDPVFCKNAATHRYYLRAGNTTYELDTQEALAHIHKRKAR